MRRVIIESPFAGDVETNKLYLRACIRDCIRRGETPYASHRMLTDALDDDDPEEREAGINAGYAWWPEDRARIELGCDIVFYVDLAVSPGMLAAYTEYARRYAAVPELRLLGPDWRETLTAPLTASNVDRPDD